MNLYAIQSDGPGAPVALYLGPFDETALMEAGRIAALDLVGDEAFSFADADYAVASVYVIAREVPLIGEGSSETWLAHVEDRRQLARAEEAES